jgi:methylenetetrahydrofolate reductase (NADPH)
METQSNLQRVLNLNNFAVTAELGPPTSADGEIVKKKAKFLKGYVDAFNVTDGQTAVVRMSSWATCLIAREEGLDPIVQMTTRDRNRIALQMDILGAAALGINNILCLTGDHISFGNHPEAKGVWDLDSIQLIRVVKKMRDDKEFESGDKMNKAPFMFIGAAANPFADPFEMRIIRLMKKINEGVDFIQTQCIFNIDKFREWMKKVCDMGLDKKVKILGGVTPIKSLGAAKYIKNKVPGMDVPDSIIDRLSRVPKEKVSEEGIKIAVETIEQLKEIEGVSGVHIMAIEWEEKVPEIVDSAGLYPRP